MRITIATGPNYPVPPLQGGAVQRVWEGLGEEFSKRGHKVTIVARAYEEQPELETRNNVRYIRWGGYSQSLSIWKDLVRNLFYSLGALRRLPEADILVTNDFWLSPLAGLKGRKVGRIVVNANRFPKGQYFLYRKAACIVAASSEIARNIVAQTPSCAARTTMVHNPINTFQFIPESTELIEDTMKRILYVGRIHPEKGIHLLVGAFNHLANQFPGLKLTIVGPSKQSQGGGGGAFLNSLKMQAKSPNIEFCEPVFNIDGLVAHYRSAGIFAILRLPKKVKPVPSHPSKPWPQEFHRWCHH